MQNTGLPDIRSGFGCSFLSDKEFVSRGTAGHYPGTGSNESLSFSSRLRLCRRRNNFRPRSARGKQLFPVTKYSRHYRLRPRRTKEFKRGRPSSPRALFFAEPVGSEATARSRRRLSPGERPRTPPRVTDQPTRSAISSDSVRGGSPFQAEAISESR